MRSSGIHSRVMFTWILEISVPKLCLKFVHMKSKPHFLGDYELRKWLHCNMMVIWGQGHLCVCHIFRAWMLEGGIKTCQGATSLLSIFVYFRLAKYVQPKHAIILYSITESKMHLSCITGFLSIFVLLDTLLWNKCSWNFVILPYSWWMISSLCFCEYIVMQ